MNNPEATEKMLECYKALKMVHMGYDLAANQLTNKLGVPLCVPNCGLCCEVNVVYAYGLEAAFAVSSLAAEPVLLSQVLNRAEGWLMDTDKSAPTKVPVIGGEPIMVTRELSGEIDGVAGKACPFLNSDKTCLIHAYRPLVCRAFGVTRIAHRDCRRPTGKIEHGAKVAYFGGLGATAVKDVIEEILREVPTPTGPKSGFFPTLLYAIAKPGLYRKLAMSGNISTAKLLMFDDFHGLLWQDQLEKYREAIIARR